MSYICFTGSLPLPSASHRYRYHIEALLRPVSSLKPSTPSLELFGAVAAMIFLDLPNEVMGIIIAFLNAPTNPYDYTGNYKASTVCLCKTETAHDHVPENYPMWPEWKRDSLAIGGVCKRFRALVFDQFWLRKAEMD